ncbi:MAG TPA: hypothetical protein VGM43_23380 [Bryobacteraceae bacterium]|jgi:hypothetical protein
MAITQQQVTQALQHGELQAFGLAMPRLAPDWSPKGASSPSFSVSNESNMTITASANWAAPLDMSFLAVDPATGTPMPVTLTDAAGAVENAKGVLLTLFDQSWLRLNRLYTQVFETSSSSRPEFDRGLPFRPVPRYIFFPTQTMSMKSGLAEAWADLGFHGDARFYDGDGVVIDPVAVMAAFAAILTKFPLLQAVDLSDPPLSPLPFTNYLTTLAPSAKVRFRFVAPDGTPYNGTHLTNVTAISGGAAAGLYELNSGSTNIALEAVSASFTQDDHDRLVFGPATSGRLTGTFTPPTSAVTLSRDFFSLRVVELNSYLVGAWPASSSDPATGVQRKPAVRINENATLLSDGNDLLAAANTALGSGADPSLAVAQAIDGAFAIPPAVGTNAHWPNFPSGVPADPSETLAVALKTQVTLTANWVTSTASDFKKADVVLQIAALPANAWVRIYSRKFLPDATEGRGDGRGGLVPAGGTLILNLTDPFSLRVPPNNPAPGDIIVPAKATLMFDMIVLLANGKSRMYGDMTVDVSPAPGTPPTSSATNPCGTAALRGVSNSGILGLGTAGNTGSAPDLATWAKNLAGENQPRDASRLPTMARRELLVAGAATNVWTGVIGGGRIATETISAATRTGAPGSPGGRETSVTGVTSHGGILAYDIARHALRRSHNIISRLADLADSNWNVPAAPTAVTVGGTPSATNGTMAGAVLQTIAPYCETPELYAAWAAGVNINTVIQYVVDNFIPNSIPARTQIVNALNTLKTTPAAPAPATETSAEQRIAVELEREVTSVYFGRRDAQWALQSAIKAARHLIYIETPGFCSTQGATSHGYTADLIALIKTQLSSRPGLRAIICVQRSPDFAPGYEGMSSYEIKDRLTIVKGQTTPSVVTPLPDAQTAFFHPIGFPGRYSRVETNVVIVDDVWAMVGGCSLRRRGLTFDGSSDLVVTDTLIENGRSAAIRDFRRALIANRLGITPDSTHPSFVALSDAQTSYRVVKDALAAGGLGDIEAVWDGSAPGTTLATALPIDQSNPEGREFDVAMALLVSVLATAAGV